MSEAAPYQSRENVAYDFMSAEELSATVLDWIKAVQEPTIDTGELSAYMQTIMPRTAFFKNLARDATVVDLGAGDGSMAHLKAWPTPARPDIRLFAVSLDKGSYFDLYEGYELGNFDKELPNFAAAPFDAVICCNFLEHIQDPERCVRWMSSVLKPGGRLFLEWPHPNWKQMPKSALLLEQGFDAFTTNFWDDRTHVDAWPMETIVSAMARSQLKVETTGRLFFPWLGDELRNHGIKFDRKVERTYAAWLRFGLGQFVIAHKDVSAD